MESLLRNLDLLAYLSLMVLQSMLNRLFICSFVGLSGWMVKSLGLWMIIGSIFRLCKWTLFYLESLCSVFIFGHFVRVTFGR